MYCFTFTYIPTGATIASTDVSLKAALDFLGIKKEDVCNVMKFRAMH